MSRIQRSRSRKRGHEINRQLSAENSSRFKQWAARYANRNHPLYTPAGLVSPDINQHITSYLTDHEVVGLRAVATGWRESRGLLLADDIETETALTQDAHFRKKWQNEIQSKKYYYTVPEAKEEGESQIYKLLKDNVTESGQLPVTWNEGGGVPVRLKKVKYNDCEYHVYDFPEDVPGFEKPETTNPYDLDWIAHIEICYGGIYFWGIDGQGGEIDGEMNAVYSSAKAEFNEYKNRMKYKDAQIEELMYGLTERGDGEVKLINKAAFNNTYRIEAYMLSYMDLQKRWVNEIYNACKVEELNEETQNIWCAIMGGRRKRTRRRRKKNRKKITKKKARRKRNSPNRWRRRKR
jgi:hypothetical protein